MNPLPSSPDMSAVAFLTAVALAKEVAKVEGLMEAVVKNGIKGRESTCGIGPTGHFGIHIQPELVNPIDAAGKSENHH